jgi:hypothetical protein
MCCPTQDSLHLTARKTGIHNMAKSGRGKVGLKGVRCAPIASGD